jgi:hypothetical protein
MGVKAELLKASTSLEKWRATAFNPEAVKKAAAAKVAIDKAEEVYKKKKLKRQEEVKKGIAFLNKLKQRADLADLSDISSVLSAFNDLDNTIKYYDRVAKEIKTEAGVKAELTKAKGFIDAGLELTLNPTGKKDGTDAKDAVEAALTSYQLKKKKFKDILLKLDGTLDKIVALEKTLNQPGGVPPAVWAKTLTAIKQAIVDAKLAEILVKKE